MKTDVVARIAGSVGVIAAYFVVLHVNVTAGVIAHVVSDAISVPYFIRTKSWDVVIMIAFLLAISVSSRPVPEVSTIVAQGAETVYIKRVKGTDLMPNAYEVSICNEDLTTSIFYITRPATKSMRGLNRQHNNVVNQVVNAIREVRGWRRLTVKRVPLAEVAQGSV